MNKYITSILQFYIYKNILTTITKTKRKQYKCCLLLVLRFFLTQDYQCVKTEKKW